MDSTFAVSFFVIALEAGLFGALAAQLLVAGRTSRPGLTALSAAVAILLAVAALFAWGVRTRARTRRLDTERLSALARVLAPVALLPLLPTLLHPPGWDQTAHLVVMAGYVLVFERLVRLGAEAWPRLRPPRFPSEEDLPPSARTTPLAVTTTTPVAIEPPAAVAEVSPAALAADAAEPSPAPLADAAPETPLEVATSAEISAPTPVSGVPLIRPRAGAPLAAGAKPQAWWRRNAPYLIVLVAALAYAVYMSLFTIWNHRRFGTFGFDLGLYNNLFFNELKGHPMRCPALGIMENWEELKNHAELSSFFFLPIYALHPDSETLLFLQSTLLGLGAIPVFRFARRRIPDSVAALLAVAYLFFAPTHSASFYDFHFQPVAAFFVLLTIDFLDEGRYVLTAFAALVAFGCREDISVGLAIAGAAFAFSGRRFWGGLALAAAASIYFVVIRFIVMPHFGTWWFADIYKDLYPDGARSFGGVMLTIVSNPLYTFRTLLTPQKLAYGLAVLLPVGLLPLRRPYLLVALIPGALFTLLTTGYGPTVDTGFQYSCHFLGYIFPAAALALASWNKDRPRFVAGLSSLVLGTLLTTANWGAFPPRDNIHGGFGTVAMKRPTEADRQKRLDLKELARTIPADVGVAISENEMPHVNFVKTLCLRDGYGEADYILYGTSSGFYGGTNAQRALDSGEFEKLAEKPGLGLLGRKGRKSRP